VSQPLERAAARPDPSNTSAAEPPNGQSSKKPIPLDPTLRGLEAVRAIHRSLIDTVVANEPGVRQALDPECLHDLRIAVRRGRSALAQINDVFAADAVAHLKAELKWLQTTTGPVRDLDVYLLKMDEYRADLPESVCQHLDSLDTYLHNHHAIEQRRLVSALDSERYRTLLQEWRALIAPDRPVHPGCANAERPIVELAAERIWRTYRRVRKNGDAITAESPDEVLHALRIECKKLRYLLEFFTSLFGDRRTLRLVAPLKVLQGTLGDFNDLTVQQRKLTDFAHDMVREQQVGADSLLAMGRLVERLAERQSSEKKRFERSYAAFAKRRVHKRFRHWFRR